jgi:hypothetical protein
MHQPVSSAAAAVKGAVNKPQQHQEPGAAHRVCSCALLVRTRPPCCRDMGMSNRACLRCSASALLAAAGMALPLCLDRLVNVAVALVLSTTAIVLFGEWCCAGGAQLGDGWQWRQGVGGGQTGRVRWAAHWRLVVSTTAIVVLVSGAMLERYGWARCGSGGGGWRRPRLLGCNWRYGKQRPTGCEAGAGAVDHRCYCPVW